MSPFEVLITKSEYDENDKETVNIIFGPKMIFAYSKDSAIKKAIVESGMSVNDVDESNFYAREYSE